MENNSVRVNMAQLQKIGTRPIENKKQLLHAIQDHNALDIYSKQIGKHTDALKVRIKAAIRKFGLPKGQLREFDGPNGGITNIVQENMEFLAGGVKDILGNSVWEITTRRVVVHTALIKTCLKTLQLSDEDRAKLVIDLKPTHKLLPSYSPERRNWESRPEIPYVRGADVGYIAISPEVLTQINVQTALSAAIETEKGLNHDNVDL